jgi:hypothetical protein
MTLSKSSKRLLATLFLAALFYVMNYFVTPDVVGVARLEEHFRPRGKSKFISQFWKEARAGSGHRFEMVDDLIKGNSLMGLDLNQVKDLLGNPDLFTNHQSENELFYMLADQKMYPAKSIWFPGLFANQDRWMLQVRLRNGKVFLAKVFFT